MFNYRAFLATALVCALAVNLPAQPVASTPTNLFGFIPPTSNEKIILPESVPDPIEPLNRVFWSFNKTVLTDVVQPTGVAYRFVVRKPVRRGISNVGRNITFPGRVFNNLIQGKWNGAREETDRFFYNTILGLGGFFDVATHMEIPKSEADFGQTFGQWGWKPKAFLMLPVFGPSNDRDTTGLVGDTLASPITYFTPYSYCTFAITYDNLVESVDAVTRFSQSEQDAYSELQYAWTFVRANHVADFQVYGQQDAPSLETLQTVFFTFKEPEFPNHGKTSSVLIPATGKKLKFTAWMQRAKAPVVYIVPGLGSHRLSDGSLALAELVFQQGFSAVCVSSPYNHEFMESASSVAMPAYTPIDAHDLHFAITEIDHRLEKLYPERLGSRALLGYSMGAFLSLYIASTQATNQEPLLKFDRFVAINTPVRLLHGVSKLDEFYNAPLEWPTEGRTPNIENTFLKVAAFTKNSMQPLTSLPFDGIESKFLIGLNFRLILRDVIYSSQKRHNQGILAHPLNTMRREALYKEIMQYSYQDYFLKFVVPYYQTRGLDLTVTDTLNRASDLHTYADGLKANHDIRLILNRNDFLLSDSDLKWLQDSVTPSQITLFEQGGHLGNLAHPEVQKAILKSLDGLQPIAPKTK